MIQNRESLGGGAFDCIIKVQSIVSEEWKDVDVFLGFVLQWAFGVNVVVVFFAGIDLVLLC